MSPLKQNHLKYGLIMSASLVLCLLMMELTGQNETFENKSPIFLIYQFILPAVIWYLGINARKKSQNNKLTFKQGLKEGFKISLVFGITSPFLFLAYYLLINPEILNYVKSAYQMPEASNTTILTIDLFAQFISAIIFGTIYGTIISLFLKNKS
jgi:hypothetical protein